MSRIPREYASFFEPQGFTWHSAPRFMFTFRPIVDKSAESDSRVSTFLRHLEDCHAR
jgi:hypothetical protein